MLFTFPSTDRKGDKVGNIESDLSWPRWNLSIFTGVRKFQRISCWVVSMNPVTAWGILNLLRLLTHWHSGGKYLFMPPPLGAGGIMFSGCPPVRRGFQALPGNAWKEWHAVWHAYIPWPPPKLNRFWSQPAAFPPFGTTLTYWNLSCLGFLGIIWRWPRSKCRGGSRGIFVMLCVEFCPINIFQQAKFNMLFFRVMWYFFCRWHVAALTTKAVNVNELGIMLLCSSSLKVQKTQCFYRRSVLFFGYCCCLHLSVSLSCPCARLPTLSLSVRQLITRSRQNHQMWKENANQLGKDAYCFGWWLTLIFKA